VEIVVFFGQASDLSPELFNQVRVGLRNDNIVIVAIIVIIVIINVVSINWLRNDNNVRKASNSEKESIKNGSIREDRRKRKKKIPRRVD
jgi:hypothetical protein